MVNKTISRSTILLYWVVTAILSALMLLLGIGYITGGQFREAFHHLGFPDYFRLELGIAKLAGAFALLAPIPKRLKEWTYAGFGITFISGFIAHLSSGDPASRAAGPLFALLLLVISYASYQRRGAR